MAGQCRLVSRTLRNEHYFRKILGYWRSAPLSKIEFLKASETLLEDGDLQAPSPALANWAGIALRVTSSQFFTDNSDLGTINVPSRFRLEFAFGVISISAPTPICFLEQRGDDATFNFHHFRDGTLDS